VGVNEDGYREILGIAEGSREDKEAWSSFLPYLKGRPGDLQDSMASLAPIR